MKQKNIFVIVLITLVIITQLYPKKISDLIQIRSIPETVSHAVRTKNNGFLSVLFDYAKETRKTIAVNEQNIFSGYNPLMVAIEKDDLILANKIFNHAKTTDQILQLHLQTTQTHFTAFIMALEKSSNIPHGPWVKTLIQYAKETNQGIDTATFNYIQSKLLFCCDPINNDIPELIELGNTKKTVLKTKK